jgi:hypothetical protein
VTNGGGPMDVEFPTQITEDLDDIEFEDWD